MDILLFTLFGMAESKLLELTKKGAISKDIPYFALCNRYFKNQIGRASCRERV